MFHRTHDFFHALNLANKAMRRGNVADAERWIRCAERHMAIAERFQALTERQAKQRPQRNPVPASK
jgi:hypothetical protein